MPRTSAPTVPKAIPVFHVEPAQPRSSSRTCSGRASVVTSRSPGPAAPAGASSASRTEPPTRCSLNPAAVNRRPSSVSTGERSTSSARRSACTAGADRLIGHDAATGLLGHDEPSGQCGTGRPWPSGATLPGMAGDGRARTPRPPAAPGRRDLGRRPGGRRRRRDRPRAALIGRTDRRGRLLWSLPKGHIEEGETPEDTAVREVAEETGIIGEVVAPLGIIDFWFVADGRRIHKTVHHFLLRADRRRALRRRHRGHRGRLGAAGRAERPAGLRRRTGTGRARARTAGRHRVSRTAPVRAAARRRRRSRRRRLVAVRLPRPSPRAARRRLPAAPRRPLRPAAGAGDDSRRRPAGADRVSRFEPRTVTPGRHDHHHRHPDQHRQPPVTDLSVRLQRGAGAAPPARSSTAVDATPTPRPPSCPPFQPSPGQLEPGGSRPLHLHRRRRRAAARPRRRLPGAAEPQRHLHGGQRRVGELATFLVQQPPPRRPHDGRLAVAAHRPHPPRRPRRLHRRRPGPRGRLRRPPGPGAGGRRAAAPASAPAGPGAPPSPVTLAIDPALVEELAIMAAGPYPSAGVAAPARAPRPPRPS